ncbi:MAG TPA: sn-glycerol-3-phosphate ABC transporter substrate-binding protein UgpB [bacterium]|nr:sn-glycerol-3-phosphate ABC transporter substrate-binding protein UgpB [bacterium]
MNPIRWLGAFLIAALVALAAPAAQAKTEVVWWHAHGGALGERVDAMVAKFNQSQSEYEVKAVYKGSYAETMTAGIAAFRAGQPPAILQVFEVGTATMMAAKGAIYPVYQLMADTGEPFDPNAYLAAVTGYYTDTEGHMLSMPFNSSTPVLWYNKDMFRKAGLNPDKPPRTWPELERDAKKLMASGGAKCGFTTAWPSWVNIENFSAWHNIPLASEQNGFGGLDARMEIANPTLEHHIAALARWQQSKIFDYGGRTNKGDSKFTTGECAMLTESSAGYARVSKESKFEFGVGMLPYWPDVKGAPQNTIIGGASLWVLRGQSPEVYKGVAKFFTYLSSAEVMAEWHQGTGYLPITLSAYKLSEEQGFYKSHPGADISIKQMTLHKPTANSKGLRLGNYPQIRVVHYEELEAALAGKISAKVAVERMQKRDNELLEQFQKANE